MFENNTECVSRCDSSGSLTPFQNFIFQHVSMHRKKTVSIIGYFHVSADCKMAGVFVISVLTTVKQNVGQTQEKRN